MIRYVIILISLIGFTRCQTLSKVESESRIASLEYKIDSLDRALMKLKKKSFSSQVQLEPGKSYVACLVHNQYERIVNSYNIYNGNDYSTNGIEEKLIITAYGQAKLDKELKELYKENDNNTIPDCVYFTYEPGLIEYDTIFIVKDTTKVLQYQREEITELKLVTKERLMQWREMIPTHHGNDRAAHLCESIQRALIKEGYSLSITRKLDEKTKASLIDYQKKNGLPIGQLDYETLRSLGIDKKTRRN